MTVRLRGVFGAVWPGLAFFAVLLLISLPEGLNTITSVAHVPLLTGASAFERAAGDTDAGSLMSAALSYSQTGKLLGGYFWVLNLWPPGMVGVDVLIIAAQNATGIPAVLLMVLLNCLVWAASLGFYFVVIRARRGLLTAGIFAVAALLYSGTSVWGMRNGLFYSDSFGALAFCTALVLLFLCAEAVGRRRIALAVVAGGFLGVAAYFRATFELINNVLFVGGIVLVVVLLLLRRMRRSPAWTGAALATAVPIAVAGAVYMLVTLPWRAYAGLRIRPGDFRWSTVADIISGQRWIPSSQLDGVASFLDEGHINWACRLDAAVCQRIADAELGSLEPYTGRGHFTNAQFDQYTTEAALGHPLQFLQERFGMLTLGFTSETGSAIGVLAVAESLLLAIALVLLVVAFVRGAGYRNPGFVVFAIATAGQFATLLLFHQESRYFLAIELSIILVAALVLRPGTRPSDEPRRYADTASESSAAP